MTTTLKRITVLLATGLALLAGTGRSQANVRTAFEEADTVVVGTVVSVNDGPETKTYVKNAPNVAKTAPSKMVGVRITSALKGSAQGTLHVVVPAEGRAPAPFTEKSLNQPYLLFLRKASQTGYFEVGQADYPMVFLAPNCSLMLGNGIRPVKLVDTTVDTTLLPLLRVADVLSRQMPTTTDSKGRLPVGACLQYLRELTPLRPSGERPLPAVEVKKYQHWFTSRLGNRLDLSNSTNALNFSAVGIAWGFRGENAKAFMRMYKETRGTGLAVAMPPLNVDEGIELFPYMPADVARGCAVDFQYYGEKKSQILQVVLARLGENDDLDKGILEALAKLYGKPELNPYREDRHYPTVADKVQRAKALFGNG